MATLAVQPLRYDKSRSGNSDEFELISVSGNIANGLLTVRTNGLDAVCASNSPAVITHLAVCLQSETVPGATQLSAIKVRPGDTYEITAHHSTAASAVVPDSALDGQSDYGIIWNTVSGQNAFMLDLQDTSNKRVRLLERISTATDVYPRCRVQFLAANLTFAD